jgi:hypothetical protein
MKERGVQPPLSVYTRPLKELSFKDIYRFFQKMLYNQNMTYKMFIDDLKFPPSDDWVVCRSMDEVVDSVKRNGCPSMVSFDHDLGWDEENNQAVPSGADIASWLINYDMMFGGMPENFTFVIHSENPIGRDNILGKLNGYLKFKNKIGQTL